jgi:hypothetical protein
MPGPPPAPEPAIEQARQQGTQASKAARHTVHSPAAGCSNSHVPSAELTRPPALATRWHLRAAVAVAGAGLSPLPLSPPSSPLPVTRQRIRLGRLGLGAASSRPQACTQAGAQLASATRILFPGAPGAQLAPLAALPAPALQLACWHRTGGHRRSQETGGRLSAATCKRATAEQLRSNCGATQGPRGKEDPLASGHRWFAGPW